MRIYKIMMGFDEKRSNGEKTTRFYPFQGESENTVPVDYGSNKGFQSHNHKQMTELLFGELGDNAYEIGGETNLRSYMDRIIARIKCGMIDPVSIVITIKEE